MMRDTRQSAFDHKRYNYASIFLKCTFLNVHVWEYVLSSCIFYIFTFMTIFLIHNDHIRNVHFSKCKTKNYDTLSGIKMFKNNHIN